MSSSDFTQRRRQEHRVQAAAHAEEEQHGTHGHGKENARKRQTKCWIGFWRRWTHLDKHMGKEQGQDHQTQPEDH